jgi:peptidyl-prolyl cis-trans isomerase C
VNGAAIDRAAIAREVQNHAGASAQQAWQEAARALVIRELLLQRARILRLEAEPREQDGARETEEEALIRAVLDAEVTAPQADDAACRRYYEANAARFRSPDLFEPAHILFQAARDDAAAYANALERAAATLTELRAHPQRFGALARALSDCASGQEEGRLGQVARGDTTPEFEAALLALQPGELCAAPVQTRYGVHIVRLDRKVAGRTLPFEQVRERIATYLEESVWRRAVAQYIALLAGQAQIEGVDFAAATSPLVQ